jgi:hypothetical protein
MVIDIRKPLRTALLRLKSERDRLDRQIQAIEGLLRLNGERTGRGGGPRRGRRRMTAAERRDVSRRMKAYWAKRRNAMKKV